MQDEQAARPVSDDDAQAERAAFLRVVAALRSYEEDALEEVARWEGNYAQLSAAHQALLAQQPAHFADARRCVAANAAFFRALLATYESPHVPDYLRVPPPPPPGTFVPRTAPGDAEKVRYVLRNLSRDWSAEGSTERGESYAPLLAALQKHLPPVAGAEPPRLLVPGAGLGRLCVDAAAAGYAAEGNECSYFMLLTSSFVMNHLGSSGAPPLPIHPWVTNPCNHISHADALRPHPIPDLRAGDAADAAGARWGSLGMAAGEFCDVYGQPGYAGAFDCCATCFFLDVSHNVVETLQVLAAALRPGGVWVNCGPLLWHWADAHTYLATPELSIELPLDEVLRLAQAVGFELLEQGWAECGYAGNARSLMHTRYRCATWAMRRR